MSITYTYEGINMYFYKYQVHCTLDVTFVEHSCEIDEVIFTLFTFTLQYWMSINYRYESNTMYLYTIKVHCTIDIT